MDVVAIYDGALRDAAGREVVAVCPGDGAGLSDVQVDGLGCCDAATLFEGVDDCVAFELAGGDVGGGRRFSGLRR